MSSSRKIVVIACALSAAMLGIDGYVVRVEADSSPGTPSFTIIGLPDRALGEARERVRAAIHQCGFPFPAGKLLVNLSPADVRKEGPGFDLPIALAILGLDEQLDRARLGEIVALGELTLDGGLRGVRGMLAMALGARASGNTTLLIPRANAAEAALVDGLEIFAVDHLADAVAVVLGHGEKFRVTAQVHSPRTVAGSGGDFADVRGQAAAKRALEIAAAGGHNVLLVGPPGCGKTMLAQRLPSILPPMRRDEALEVTKVYSVAGLLAPGTGVIEARPFRSPHHTISQIALVGGGSVPRPGEISLAHHGVLFLDELPEFRRSALEVLRQPLEEGRATISRAAGSFTYPAAFALVVAMNPCPCGFRGSREHDCRCDDGVVAKYLAKLSGPLLDRIDLHVDVARVPFDDLVAPAPGEASNAICGRVVTSRERQARRLGTSAATTNARIVGADVRRYCALGGAARDLVRAAAARSVLSARAVDRVARVARTIADLAGADDIGAEHVGEALMYRCRDERPARALSA